MWRDSKLYFTSLPDDSVISPELHYCCREKTSFIRSKALDLLPFYIPRNLSLSLIPSPTYSASPSQSSSPPLPPSSRLLQKGKFSHKFKGQEVTHGSPRVRWVVGEGWEREFQIRKVAQMGEWLELEFQKWQWPQLQGYSPTFPDMHLKALLWNVSHLFSQHDWKQGDSDLKPKKNDCKSLEQSFIGCFWQNVLVI